MDGDERIGNLHNLPLNSATRLGKQPIRQHQRRRSASTVLRVLTQAGLPRTGIAPRASRIDPYLPFIRETLAQFPTLTASRLYVMVKERGYPGRPDHFRHLVALQRPRPKAEAYLRLRTLPGEQAQVDWGHFGHLEIGRARLTFDGTAARCTPETWSFPAITEIPKIPFARD